MLAAREGQALPDLTLARDGDAVVLCWEPDPEEVTTKVRFLGRGRLRLPFATVRDALAALIDATLRRFEETGQDGEVITRLQQNWSAIAESSRTELRMCSGLAKLGLDPYDCSALSESLLSAISIADTELGPELFDDLLEGTSLPLLDADLQWTKAGRQALGSGGLVRPGDAEAPIAFVPSAHQFGYDLARRVRAMAPGLDRIGPVGNLPELLVDRFAWSQQLSNYLPSERRSRIEAIVGCTPDDGRPSVVVARKGSPEGTRFRLARALYLHVSGALGSGPRLLSGASTTTQRSSRAFAAELLLPAAALAGRIRGAVCRAEVDDLAEEYQVSDWVVKHQIENHGIGALVD